MNDKTNETNQPEKSGLDDNRKNALLRYLGIMFVVAFIFVLVSLIGELRTSEATISELSASSTSALQKAEQLQDTNRELETDNAYLEGRIEELEKQLEEVETDLEDAQQAAADQEALADEREAALADTQTHLEQIQKAYDLLAEAQNLLSQEQDASQLLSQLEHYKQYLGENALNIYENLTKEGE